MRIKGDYLRNLTVLLNRWADDIDRLDVRIRSDNPIETLPVKRQAPESRRYESPPDSGGIANSL